MFLKDVISAFEAKAAFITTAFFCAFVHFFFN